jgi:hypothetical protein
MSALRCTSLLTLLGFALLAQGAAADPIHEIDYAPYDVRVTDTKGTVTDATEFGYFAGPNILQARRGDGVVEIPWRKIRRIEIGDYIPSKGYAPATVTARSGRVVQVELESLEGQRMVGGYTDVGSFRIRMIQIRRLDLIRLSHSEDLGPGE